MIFPIRHRRLLMAKADIERGKSPEQAAVDWRLLPNVLKDYRRGKRRAERERERRIRATRRVIFEHEDELKLTPEQVCGAGILARQHDRSGE
jgi:hypothetical protein